MIFWLNGRLCKPQAYSPHLEKGPFRLLNAPELTVNSCARLEPLSEAVLAIEIDSGRLFIGDEKGEGELGLAWLTLEAGNHRRLLYDRSPRFRSLGYTSHKSRMMTDGDDLEGEVQRGRSLRMVPKVCGNGFDCMRLVLIV